MVKYSEEKIRKTITDMFVLSYVPEMKKEVELFVKESFEKQLMASEMSEIVGKPIGIYLGELKVAKPINSLIDNLVKLYVKETKK